VKSSNSNTATTATSSSSTSSTLRNVDEGYNSEDEHEGGGVSSSSLAASVHEILKRIENGTFVSERSEEGRRRML